MFLIEMEKMATAAFPLLSKKASGKGGKEEKKRWKNVTKNSHQCEPYLICFAFSSKFLKQIIKLE